MPWPMEPHIEYTTGLIRWVLSVALATVINTLFGVEASLFHMVHLSNLAPAQLRL